MAPKPAKAVHSFVGLPLLVVSPVDLGRLIREAKALDSALRQAALRGSDARISKTSKLMDETVELNKVDLLAAHDRQQLIRFLELSKERAPVLHISFSADPAPSFIEKLMVWLRREIHPLVLMTIGLQPNLGAGCVVRSTNKYFDFSLRQNFKSNTDLLMSKLREVS